VRELRDWEPQPKSKKALEKASLEMMGHLKLITRAARMQGPLGPVYFIPLSRMQKAAALIAQVEGARR